MYTLDKYRFTHTGENHSIVLYVERHSGHLFSVNTIVLVGPPTWRFISSPLLIGNVPRKSLSNVVSVRKHLPHSIIYLHTIKAILEKNNLDVKFVKRHLLKFSVLMNIQIRATPKVLGLFLSRKSNMSYLFLFEKNNEISFPIWEKQWTIVSHLGKAINFPFLFEKSN